MILSRATARRLWVDQSGAAMVEYSILIGVITAAIMAALLAVSGYIDAAWQTLADAL